VQRRISAGANLPSKIASYLASGSPIVASLGLDTPAAELLQESSGALLVAPEDPNALADAMRRLRDDVVLADELGRRGRKFAEQQLSKEHVLPQLEQAILQTSRSG
jgi:colanic acid biosynthesis glycosyl transferase WcaI